MKDKIISFFIILLSVSGFVAEASGLEESLYSKAKESPSEDLGSDHCGGRSCASIKEK